MFALEKLGQICIDSEECSIDHYNSFCNFRNRCGCKRDFRLTTNLSCVEGKCNGTADCQERQLANTWCNDATSTCECLPGYDYVSDAGCIKGPTLPCHSDAICQQNFNHAECDLENSKCQCKGGYLYRDNRCEASPKHSNFSFYSTSILFAILILTTVWWLKRR